MDVESDMLAKSHGVFYWQNSAVRTKCRNSAARPIDGIDFNAKCTQCALFLPMKNATIQRL